MQRLQGAALHMWEGCVWKQQLCNRSMEYQVLWLQHQSMANMEMPQCCWHLQNRSFLPCPCYRSLLLSPCSIDAEVCQMSWRQDTLTYTKARTEYLFMVSHLCLWSVQTSRCASVGRFLHSYCVHVTYTHSMMQQPCKTQLHCKKEEADYVFVLHAQGDRRQKHQYMSHTSQVM